MPRSAFPNTTATLSTITLSAAQIDTLADGNPVEVVPGVDGVIHVPVSALWVNTPGTIPYEDTRQPIALTWDQPGLTGSALSMTYANIGVAGMWVGVQDSIFPANLAGAALVLSPDGPWQQFGSIDTSVLVAGGTGNAVNDVALVSNLNPTVVTATPGTKTFVLDDVTPTGVNKLVVAGANAGLYTIVSGAGTDTVVVAEAFASSETGVVAHVGSALLTVDTVTGDAVDTYTVTDAGLQYYAAVGDPWSAYSPTGGTFSIDITAITPLSSATGVLTLLSYDVTV